MAGGKMKKLAARDDSGRGKQKQKRMRDESDDEEELMSEESDDEEELMSDESDGGIVTRSKSGSGRNWHEMRWQRRFMEHKRAINTPQFQKYSKSSHDSHGFDVPRLPNKLLRATGLCGLIMPMPNFRDSPRILEQALEGARLAMVEYNKTDRTKYDFVDVLKVNTKAVSGFRHYVTFEAKPRARPNAAHKIFQAILYCGIKEKIKVTLVRPKPKSQLP